MTKSTSALLTSKDVLSKSFAARTRRGYDPAEVDTYLRKVADGVDALHAEIETLSGNDAELPPPPPPEALAKLEGAGKAPIFVPTRGATPAPEVNVAPTPDATPIAAVEEAPAPPQMSAPPTREPDSSAPAQSAEIILEMARDTAERTLAEANRRSDEIVAEAAFKASEVAREADRRAFDNVNRYKAELAELEDVMTERRQTLEEINKTIEGQLDRAGLIGEQLTDLAEKHAVSGDSVVVDLSGSAQRRAARSEDSSSSRS